MDSLVAALAFVVAVLLVCCGYAARWFFYYRHRRWELTFEAAQKPLLELAKVKAELDARMTELEKAHRTAQLRKLG